MSRSPEAEVKARARSLGFAEVGVASLEEDDGTQAPRRRRRLDAFLAQGLHGDMTWLARRARERARPKALWPEARAVVAVGSEYGPAHDPRRDLERRERGAISVYARGGDYHDAMKSRLKTLAGWLVERFGCRVKVFVDTAPVMEKPLAQAAGLGWQGKHTNLVSRRLGSWFFLGEIFTTLELEPDRAEGDHCGSCRACQEVCPTAAFPAPYRLDARRCISYLTIEHKGHIGREFRTPMGNRIFGCDDCLAVCPWNKYARRTAEHAFLPRIELTAPRLADLAALDDAGFRELFRASPVKRTGRDRFLRNVMIALGNSGRAEAVDAVAGRLDDASPLVRAMAVWALGRLLAPARFVAWRAARYGREADAAVRAEWDLPEHAVAS